MNRKWEKLKIIIKAIFTSPIKTMYVIINAFENEKKDYVSKKYKISQLPTIDILDLFPKINEVINEYSFLEGTSLPTDLVLLKMLAKSYKECRYLEIGRWRGESLMTVAEVAGYCVSIDLPVDKMKARGYSDKFIANQGFFLKNNEKIRLINCDSQEFDFAGLSTKFNLIFVDGDHSYLSVYNDSKNVLKLLANDDAVIVWHDYANSPESVRHEVLAAMLDALPPEEHKNLFHISNTLCAIYTKKKSPTTMISYPEIPNKYFTISLAVKHI